MARKHRGTLCAVALAAGMLLAGGAPVHAQEAAASISELKTEGLLNEIGTSEGATASVKKEDALILPESESAPEAISESETTQPTDQPKLLPLSESGQSEHAEKAPEPELEPEPELKNGWEEHDGNRYYYENGQPVKGWRNVEGKLRYFDLQTGAMTRGWLTLNGNRYYTNEDGAFRFGWTRVEGKLRYFDYGTGAMAIGLSEIGGKTYYTDEDGIFKFGWLNAEGHLRFFDYGTGVMAVGWSTIGGKTYFTNEDGTFRFGWHHDGEKIYHLNCGTGVLDRGLTKVNGKTYYFDQNGVMQDGWQRVGGKLRYFDTDSGEMAVGWTTIGGKKYYTYSDGTFALGWAKVEGKLRYFNPSSGVMMTGLQNIGGGRYYILSDGRFYFGWARVGGRMHYFDRGTGRMRFGWVTVDGKMHYFTDDGSSIGTGWKKIGAITYYFEAGTPAPYMLHDTTKQIGDHLFQFESDGSSHWADNEFRFRNEFRVTKNRLYLYDADGDVYASRWVSNRHVVVSTQHQFMWAFENGKLAFSTPVITGKPSTPTVTGAFSLYSMERNVVLRGDDYESPVSYWMPFHLGYGLHDAPWQSSYNFEFDSDANYRVGSHGCVNLKPSAAARLYWFLDTGASVNIY